MFLAIQQGYYSKAVECIEAAADINICDGEGRTPLIRCILLKDQQKAVGLTRALLAHGAGVSHRDKHGLNALHYSCMEGLSTLTGILLGALDCDVNVKCRKTGNTPLHFSAISGSEDVSRKLVSHITRYRLNIDVQNRMGDTALALALKFSYNAIVKLLVNNGANFQLISRVKKVNKSAKQRNVQSARPLGKRAQKELPRIKTSKSAPVSAKSYRKDETVKTSTVIFNEPVKQHTPASVPAYASPANSWREIIPMIWSKYTQQNSTSFRRPADLEQGEKIYKLLAEQAELEAEEMNIAALNGGRRNSSMAYLGPPISRRGSLFQAAKAPPTKFEQIRSRRQSVAV